MILYIDRPPVEQRPETVETYVLTEERRAKLSPAFAFRAFSLAELKTVVSQNPNSLRIPGAFVQLFRDDPRLTPEVFTHWEEFAAPPEETHEEQYLRDFMAELQQYLEMYDRMVERRNSKAAAECKEGILIMIASFRASGHAKTSPDIDTKINDITQELSLAA